MRARALYAILLDWLVDNPIERSGLLVGQQTLLDATLKIPGCQIL